MTDKRRQNALRPEQDERVRAAVRKLLAEAGTQGQLAARLGVSQQTLSRHLNGFPAGPHLAEAVASAMGIDFDELVLGRKVIREDEEPRFSNLPGWDEAEAEARRRFRRVPEAAWKAVRDLRGASVPARVTPEWIGMMATAYAEALERPDDEG